MNVESISLILLLAFLQGKKKKQNPNSLQNRSLSSSENRMPSPNPKTTQVSERTLQTATRPFSPPLFLPPQRTQTLIHSPPTKTSPNSHQLPNTLFLPNSLDEPSNDRNGDGISVSDGPRTVRGGGFDGVGAAKEGGAVDRKRKEGERRGSASEEKSKRKERRNKMRAEKTKRAHLS